MAYTITLTSANEYVASGSYLQLIITWDVDTSGSNESYSFSDKNILVTSWGSTRWSYNIEDALLLPGTMKMKLSDVDLYIHDLLFGTTAAQVATEKTPQVELKRNGTTMFIGNLVEDKISYDYGNRILNITVAPQLDVLNKKMLYDGDASPDYLNPFSYTLDTYETLTDIIEDAFQVVNSSLSYSGGSIDIYHDWLFDGNRYDPNDGNNLQTITFDEINQKVNPLFFDSSYGINTLGDLIRKLCLDWCCYAGMVHQDKAFFRKLFKYDSSNTQTLSEFENWTKSYKYGLIDYVRVITTVGTGQVWHAPSSSAFTELENRYIRRDEVLPTFFAGGSNVRATVARGGSDDGEYNIFYAKDADISASFQGNGYLIANFWYNFRGNIENCRVDKFHNVLGVNYDPLKSFQYDSKNYQVIDMEIKWDQNKTDIEAIYLGS